MRYIYSSKAVEELKQNCDELEKLEKEYVKRIEEERQGKEKKKPRVFSAVKIGNKNINNEKGKEKKRGGTIEKNKEKNNNIDLNKSAVTKKNKKMI